MIRSSGPIARSLIAKKAGLSKPTVTDVVENLRVEGFVRVSHRQNGRDVSSQHPQMYEFCSDKHSVLGIDIGADKLIVMVADLDGNILKTDRRETSHLRGKPPGELLTMVAETSHQLLKETRSMRGGLLAVAVGTPGVISPEGKVSLAPQLAGWEGLDLQASLSEIFTCPVHIEREVILSLLAEQWLGVAQGLEDAMFIQLGVGVGAGFLMNGQVYRGADGSAGEIGFMPVRGGTHGVESTEFGSFESVVGGNALAREGAKAARAENGRKLLELANGDPTAVTAKTVLDAARAGDNVASRIVSDALDVLAEGIASIACAFNPRAVILSGGMARAGELLRGPLEKRVALLVPFAPQFLTSTLGEESVALGAIRRVTRTIEEDLIFTDEEFVS